MVRLSVMGDGWSERVDDADDGMLEIVLQSPDSESERTNTPDFDLASSIIRVTSGSFLQTLSLSRPSLHPFLSQ